MLGQKKASSGAFSRPEAFLGESFLRGLRQRPQMALIRLLFTDMEMGVSSL